MVAESNVSPAGSSPEICVPAYGRMPPMTRTGWEYGTLKVGLGSEPVWTSGDTMNGIMLVAVAPVASVTVTVASNVPLAVGTPQTSASPAVSRNIQSPPAETRLLCEPLPERIDVPGGSPDAVHVNGAIPPLRTAIPRLHVVPTVQSSRVEYRLIDGSGWGDRITSSEKLPLYQ